MSGLSLTAVSFASIYSLSASEKHEIFSTTAPATKALDHFNCFIWNTEIVYTEKCDVTPFFKLVCPGPMWYYREATMTNCEIPQIFKYNIFHNPEYCNCYYLNFIDTTGKISQFRNSPPCVCEGHNEKTRAPKLLLIPLHFLMEGRSLHPSI